MTNRRWFNGQVDLDFLSKGDYLSAIGSMVASWHGEKSGDIYVNEIFNLQKLDLLQKRMVRVYAIFHLIGWTSEEGIRFNSNSSSEVNWGNVKKKKPKIMSLYHSIN